MKTRTLLPALLAAWLAAASAQADTGLDTAALVPQGPCTALLAKKYIYAATTGSAPVPFDRAIEVYRQPALLDLVQKEYCRLLADGGEPEFTINQTSTNTYFYVNKKGERTDIVEVLRRPTGDGVFDLVFYSAGDRDFGRYEALIHVRLERGPDGGTRYTAAVYAYPENRVCRFFARHLGLVEHYFRNKTAEMTGLVTRISLSLCAAASQPVPVFCRYAPPCRTLRQTIFA